MATVELAQIVDDRLLLTVWKQIDDSVATDVGDHAAGSDDVDFVDPHPGRSLEPDCFLQFVHVVAEDVAHCLLVEADVLGDASEGSTQALLADPVHQAVGHFPPGVDGRQGLHEGLAARLAPPALGIHVDGDALAMDRQVADDLLIASVAKQAIVAAGQAVCGRLREFGADVVIALGFLDPQDLVGGEIQDVGGHRRGINDGMLTSHGRGNRCLAHPHFPGARRRRQASYSS
ncbi:hypothetical protein GALL_414070 [mine drainage metagenome]|uniref:Uncharacterized protein n=1 Tax=mine drainage metagenome TaxID=410659 RepID=A0A1J5QLK8_9ZZZZ